MFLLTVASIWTLAVVTPGPNFVVVMRSALGSDLRIAAAAVAGIASGTAVWGIAGWLGISALFTAAPTAFVALKVAGGAYLCWVGLRLLWSAWRGGIGAHVPTPSTLRVLRSAYLRGLLTILANPKTAIFVASLFAAALPQDYHWGQGLGAVGAMIAISATWYMLVAFAFTRPAIAAAYGRARRAIDGLIGTIFAAFGTHLMASSR